MEPMRGGNNNVIKPWWMLIPLWGLDIPLVALAWGVLIAALFSIPMLTFGPLLLLFSMVWVYVLFTRVTRAMMGREVPYAEYYQGHAFLMLLVALCAFFATLWMLFFSVGQYLIAFFTVPLLISVVAHMPFLKKVPFFRELGLSVAFVFACAVPSYFYSFMYSPLHMLQNKHLWCLCVLFFLFQVEKARPLAGEAGERTAVWVPFGMALFFTACLYMLVQVGNGYEQHFYGSLCIATAFLHVLGRMRSRFQQDVWFSFHWGMMALPALLSISIYAPETWFH